MPFLSWTYDDFLDLLGPNWGHSNF